MHADAAHLAQRFSRGAVAGPVNTQDSGANVGRPS
jgi:hypothetical protein